MLKVPYFWWVIWTFQSKTNTCLCCYGDLVRNLETAKYFHFTSFQNIILTVFHCETFLQQLQITCFWNRTSKPFFISNNPGYRFQSVSLRLTIFVTNLNIKIEYVSFEFVDNKANEHDFHIRSCSRCLTLTRQVSHVEQEKNR